MCHAGSLKIPVVVRAKHKLVMPSKVRAGRNIGHSDRHFTDILRLVVVERRVRSRIKLVAQFLFAGRAGKFDAFRKAELADLTYGLGFVVHFVGGNSKFSYDHHAGAKY